MKDGMVKVCDHAERVLFKLSSTVEWFDLQNQS